MYSVFMAYLLLFLGGFLGVHRFYLGKIGTGILYLLTGGFAGIGLVYDFFTLPRQVRDANIEARYRRALDGPYAGAPPRQVGPPPQQRQANRDSIERVILKIAKANQGIAPLTEVALEANIKLDEAKKNLEQLVSKGFAEVRVSKAGKLLYVFPDFTTEETEARLEDF